MKHSTLLFTTLLTAGMIGGHILPASAADNIITDTVQSAGNRMTLAQKQDSRVAATSFVQYINYARIALAMKNPDLALQHIAQARKMMILMKDITVEKQRVTNIGSGNVIYNYNTEYKDHYFPIHTGEVEVKELDGSSLWASDNLAISDANMVYLTLDFTHNKAQNFLEDSEKAIRAKNLTVADNKLAQLMNAVMTVEKNTALPQVKAHDNIALAKRFIEGKNYNGANYALKHADEALDEMQRADNNKAQRENITNMRKDVKELQHYVEMKDPTMIQKMDQKVDIWWKDLRTWSASE